MTFLRYLTRCAGIIAQIKVIWNNYIFIYSCTSLELTCYKQREKPNVVVLMELILDVEGKDVILVDDIIDTAGTITKAADLIISKGANTVRVFCTHPIFSGSAYERLNKSKITEIVVTDTVPLKQTLEKIRVLSTADLLAEVIHRVQNFESISSLFNIKKKLD